MGRHDRLHAAQLADAAIVIELACTRIRVGTIIMAALGLARLVLVVVVADMLGRGAAFMPAVARRRRPGELDRQQHEQDNDQPATHYDKDNGTL